MTQVLLRFLLILTTLNLACSSSTKVISADLLPKSVVRDIIMSREKQYLDCYDRQLQVKRDLKGEIWMKIHISNQGEVLKSIVHKSTMNNSEVERCIVNNFKELRFLAPKNGKTLIITYPLRFKPKS